MRRILCFVIAVGILSVSGYEAYARPKKQKPAASQAGSSKDAKRTKEILAKKRQDLENTSWVIEFAPAPSDKTGQKKADSIGFKNNQFFSEGSLSKGFKPTNYSLNMQDDGAIIFETMQTSEKEGTLFWRGEFAQGANTLKGMISEVFPDQKTQDTYFTGTQAVGVEAKPQEGKKEEGKK